MMDMMGSSPFCKSMDMVDVCAQLMRDGGGGRPMRAGRHGGPRLGCAVAGRCHVQQHTCWPCS